MYLITFHALSSYRSTRAQSEHAHRAPRMLLDLGQANNVASSNAIALVIINNGDNGEDLFRVAATLGVSNGVGQPTEEEPKGPQSMATVSSSVSIVASMTSDFSCPLTSRSVRARCSWFKRLCMAHFGRSYHGLRHEKIAFSLIF